MGSLDYFNDIAGQWNNIREDYFDEILKNKIIRKEEIINKVCADLGSGTGFVSLELAKNAQLVFAVDQSKNMLNELNRESQKSNYKNVYPIRGEFTDIPLFDESMDHVFTNMALHHVEDPLKGIKEMYRILKDGGILHISDVEQHDGAWAHTEMHDVWLGFTHAQVGEWLREAGFKEFEIMSSGLHCKGYSSEGVFTKTGIFIAIAKK